ncbi:MAG TPA: DUF1343 domain-containing protein [Hanamia sp.]|nr:DUF1343 domain-containing protein [Hanamia sp.]
MNLKYLISLALLVGVFLYGYGQNNQEFSNNDHNIIVGAARLSNYLPLLKNKRVAILTNQSALVNGVSIVDVLLKNQVNIVKIFGPEHGFLGIANAGATVTNSTYSKAKIPVISLFGKDFKPTPEELSDVDVMIYDAQDVGVRYYTDLASMQFFMEAAAENHKPFIILDRPDPIGFYVDGPILDKRFTSLVGMQPIPIVYGMTIGEYAKMLIGQHWLSSPEMKPDLTVIECAHYTHDSLYKLPAKPSPNLHNMASIYLYPSLCFFEGTPCSVGRGTKYPFQLFGHPDFPDSLYSFTPLPELGATDPKLNGQVCHGFLVATNAEEALQKVDHHLQLRWVIEAYKLFPEKEKFFLRHFTMLAGTDKLQQEIKEGWSEERIRKSWQPGLRKFERIREKYLLYPDFTH